MTPLYVITTVFNPRRFKSRYRLYREFAQWLRDCGVSLLTVEIAFGDRPHEITSPSDPWHLQLFTRHELWHKERALNLGLARLSQLVPDWKYTAWMDADIRLVTPGWPEETVHLLQHYAVLQLFGEASWLGPDNQQLFCARSIARNFQEYGVIDWYDHPGMTFRDKKKQTYIVKAGHPGLGWAFRREELDRIGGWLDTCVNGSADLHMAGCFTGKPELALPEDISPGYRKSFHQYGERCERQIRRNVSYLPGQALHFWHGQAKQRGYEERGGLLVKFQYDPSSDIFPDSQGLWKWNLDDPRVHALAVETRRSLADRNEDTIEAS